MTNIAIEHAHRNSGFFHSYVSLITIFNGKTHYKWPLTPALFSARNSTTAALAQALYGMCVSAAALWMFVQQLAMDECIGLDHL
jgi:hypothetical protein